jgi:hypothetical protein
MSLHYILVIQCNIDDSFAMRLNHSKKFNIKQFNILKFGEVIINRSSGSYIIFTNPEMWCLQGMHIVSSSVGLPSIGTQGNCEIFFNQNSEPYAVYH